MNVRILLLMASTVFCAFVLQHLPMPDILSWLQPAWVLLAITILVLRLPQWAGLWLAIPLGLMLDAEQGTVMGLHILTLALTIYLLQVLYKRIVVFNVLQQMGVVFLLVALQQIISFWALSALTATTRPIDIWRPALTSAFVWPWVYALVSIFLRKIQHH